MVEAEVTVEEAGDALYTAFRVAQEAIDATKAVLGGADLRTLFLYTFRTVAVCIGKAGGELSAEARLTIAHVFWLDKEEPEGTAELNASTPDGLEVAIVWLCNLTTVVGQADQILGRPAKPKSNQMTIAANRVLRAVLAADQSTDSGKQRFGEVMARLEQAVPAMPGRPAAAAPSPPEATVAAAVSAPASNGRRTGSAPPPHTRRLRCPVAR